ncbi:Phosphatidylinositol 3,4,5-trisphosphate 3-phosphatase and protein-tyrosine-phosphatase pten1 [Turnera subulata]|uniref:Phosphatidylinositol 3,4,5-trisphosphate 3-phosphatase and protein-tyrosine-phosphatase pten1 n=1 Tax=Turnera subulata TaxID=218843 RepID=A0A9Q0J329_9ROSI|nr:Phosphatidylinositol 3,4,5-trisphosphate 3-phosphatase and protein-tyrosine-phosphatase pten1 [Turnera subulata]
MGLKLSKQGPGKLGTPNIEHAKYSLISYLTHSNYIRSLVSKHRRRMVVAGYDLDMSYITDNVLAMSFPAERMRAVYRNPLWQVKAVLDMRHNEHYKIFNLCIEETYDPKHFHGRVETYPFDDNHVPPLHMVKLFCESVHSWLAADPKNIAVIHCMAGKGRTGLMVCAYLVYSGMKAEDALQLYANKRTTNNEGVSIPSQRRYVGYWEKILSFPEEISRGIPEVSLPQPCSRELRRIRLYDMVNTDSAFFVVSELQEIPGQLYRPPVEVAKSCCRPIKKGYHRNTSPRYYVSYIEGDEEEEKSDSEKTRLIMQMDTEYPTLYQKTCLEHYFDKPVKVQGDVRVIFYQKMIGGRLFYVCFNTAFIQNSLLQAPCCLLLPLQFTIRDLDKLGKGGRSICGSSFCLELLFGPANYDSSFLPSDGDSDDSF